MLEVGSEPSKRSLATENKNEFTEKTFAACSYGCGCGSTHAGAFGAASATRGAEAARPEVTLTVNTSVPTPVQPSDEEIDHLIQDDDLIAKIHSEELPPDEYYDKLGPALSSKFPGADPLLVEHVVALTAAFDTATSFALSFGIAKFQLGQVKVKLVGEYVGREGRSPNPDLVSAIRSWPPINDLKELQSFLGTTNYARPHMGPAYARVAHPLRRLLSPSTAVWPRAMPSSW